MVSHSFECPAVNTEPSRQQLMLLCFTNLCKQCLKSKYKLTVACEFCKPRLHKRFFPWDGDAFFSKSVALPVRSENHTFSHPCTSAQMATAKQTQQKLREIE